MTQKDSPDGDGGLGKSDLSELGGWGNLPRQLRSPELWLDGNVLDLLVFKRGQLGGEGQYGGVRCMCFNSPSYFRNGESKQVKVSRR